MNTVTLPAHFDGQKIVLDQPYKLEPDAKLAVVVLTASAEDEPEYPFRDVKVWNPKYTGPRVF